MKLYLNLSKPTNTIIMTINISNLELKASFQPTLIELSKSKAPLKVSWNAAKTIKSVGAAIDTFDAARQNILESRCSKDSEGKPVTETQNVINEQGITVPSSVYVFPTPEIKAETESLLDALAKTMVDVEIYPVKLDDFGSSEQITGLSVLALREFITE